MGPQLPPERKDAVTIRGRAMEAPDGKGAVWAVVTLIGRGSGKARRARTKEDGTYAFTDLPAGGYSVYVGPVPSNVYVGKIEIPDLRQDMGMADLLASLPNRRDAERARTDPLPPVT
jgi:hypothetical protein